jgi:transposase
LRIFLEYKAIQSGVKLVKVNPTYTSFICHQCNHIHPVSGKSYRSGKSFKCGHWGCPGDSDLNGAMNISVLGGAVNPLGGSVLFCSIADPIGTTESPRLLCVG